MAPRPSRPPKRRRWARRERSPGRSLRALPAWLFPLVALVAFVGMAHAAPSRQSALCDRAAVRAAKATGVPVSVLKAITRTETGRPDGGRLRPWPWTVNMEGEGRWFETAGAALDYARSEHARGARSFDVGCFQVNYRWHGHAFRSIAEMFDPKANALYAARFLVRLFQESGDWSAAAGAYHSRTPRHARPYVARFERLKAALPDGADTTDAPRSRLASRTPRRTGESGAANRFPFLKGKADSRLGSLVPVSQSAASPLISRARPLE